MVLCTGNRILTWAKIEKQNFAHAFLNTYYLAEIMSYYFGVDPI